VALPATPLPYVTELLIDGSWVTATSDVRDTPQFPGPQITRGRDDESGRVTPTTCILTLDNNSADYSNRLPTSLYYGKLGRNTQLRHRLRWVYDTMDRNVANSWGSTTSGQAWTNAGTAGDYFGDGTAMFHKHTSRNVYRTSTVALPVGCADVTATFSAPAVATGAAIYFQVIVGSDLSNYYAVTATLTTAGTVTLGIGKMVAGSLSAVGGTSSVGSYAANTKWTVRLQRTAGGYLRAKAWLATADQPSQWGLAPATPDASLTSFTTAGVRSLLDSANTNAFDVFLAFWDFEVSHWRFWGEVPSWPQTWDTTGADVTAPIEAAGIMRRLGGSTRPLRSALTRAMIGTGDADIDSIAHWSMEDESGATQFASSFSGQPAAVLTGSVDPAAYSGFAGSAALPLLRDGNIIAELPVYASTGFWQIQFAMMIPTAWAVDADLVSILMVPGGTVARIAVRWSGNSTPSAPFQITAYDSAGAILGSNSGILAPYPGTPGTPLVVSVSDFTLAGTRLLSLDQFDTVYGINQVGISLASGSSSIGTDVGMPRQVKAQALAITPDWCFGQLALYTDAAALSTPNVGPNARAGGGYVGETATDRMVRLCREEGVYLEVTGDTADAAAMGPQRPGKLLDLLFECADADFGILYEPRDALGLAYRTRPSLYNQTGLALDYAASQVFAPFSPTEDDQLIVNDATARRPSGSFARVIAEPGPLSTAAPPDGVGPYDEDRTYNVYADGQLAPIAGWRVHLGSWDEARYPQVHVMLHAPAFSASAALTAQVAATDVGDYLSVDNPPAWLPPNLIELLAQGYRETHHTYEWDITWNCVPAGPYKVFILDDSVLGRLEGDHALNSSVTTSATSWSVKTLSGPVLTAVDAEDGMQWMVEGELVTVTDISGTSSPQTATVTRNVNGIPGGKAHGADAAVALHPAPYLAL
jgi:hypothetical protein